RRAGHLREIVVIDGCLREQGEGPGVATWPRALVRGRALVRKSRTRLPLHALPAGTSRRGGDGGCPRRTAQRRDPGSAQPDAGAECRTAPDAGQRIVKQRHDRAVVVSALKHAAPYIRLYMGKVFVLKVGGEVFADLGSTRALMEQVGILNQVGIRVVLVHGGGPQSTRLAAALGLDA